MRKSIIALVAAAGLCCSLQQAVAESVWDQTDQKTQKEDFELIEKIGTRKAYEVFVQTYRTGPYVDRAQAHLDKLRELDGKAEIEFNRRLLRQQSK